MFKLIGHLIRNIFMEKVCGKPAVKTVPYAFLIWWTAQNSQCMYEIFENKLVLKETMKKVTWFFSLHPVAFHGENFGKQKCLELVTSPLSCKTCLQKEKGKNDERLNRWKNRFSKLKILVRQSCIKNSCVKNKLLLRI